MNNETFHDITTDQLKVAFVKIPPSMVRKFLLDRLPQEQFVSLLTHILSDSDLRLWLGQSSADYLKSLEPFITESATRLFELGIARETMAIAMRTINFSPKIDAAFADLGSRRTRHCYAKALLKPIPVLEDLAAQFGTFPEEVPGAKCPSPRKVIADLKLLSSMLHWGDWLYGFLGTNSFFEVSRFSLASLVYEISEQFLDNDVSCLISAALDDPNYDENRHRVWRINNRERLQKNAQIATRLLLALNQVFLQAGAEMSAKSSEA